MRLDIMGYLKIFIEVNQNRLKKNIEKEPITFGEEMNLDNTGIGNIMAVSFTLQFINVIITIICCSYYFAMGFKIFCEIQNEFFGWDSFNLTGEAEPEHFTTFYDI